MYEDHFRNYPSFSLDDALTEAANAYKEEFLVRWGLESRQPPEDMDRDDWIECRKVYGQAGQIAAAARTLAKRKGLGADTLALPVRLENDAQTHVLDLKTEFAVMARGALDSALQDTLDEVRRKPGHVWAAVIPASRIASALLPSFSFRMPVALQYSMRRSSVMSLAAPTLGTASRRSASTII